MSFYEKIGQMDVEKKMNGWMVIRGSWIKMNGWID